MQIQGHRGARGLAPENTLEGFKITLETGVHGIEFDVVMSADDEIVICHDLRLNPEIFRDASGNWLESPGPIVNELDLKTLRTFDAGRLNPRTDYAKRYPEQVPVDGARIPTLDEFVVMANDLGFDDFVYNIEVKMEPDRKDESVSPQRFAEILVPRIHALGIASSCVVQSFWWDLPRAVLALDADIPVSCLCSEQTWGDNIQRDVAGVCEWTGYDIRDFDGSVSAMASALGATVWAPYFEEITSDSVAQARAAGLRVIPWTVNDKDSMERLINWGVDGIISDYPDRLREVAKSLDVPVPVSRLGE